MYLLQTPDLKLKLLALLQQHQAQSQYSDQIVQAHWKEPSYHAIVLLERPLPFLDRLENVPVARFELSIHYPHHNPWVRLHFQDLPEAIETFVSEVENHQTFAILRKLICGTN